MADIYQFKVGDKITLNPYNAPREVTSPWHRDQPRVLIPSSNPDVFIPAKGSLVSFSRRWNCSPTILAGRCTTISAFSPLPAWIPSGCSKRCWRRSRQFAINKFIPRARQYSNLYIEENLKGYVMFIPINVTIFGLITLLITLLTVRRMIVQQETETRRDDGAGFTAWDLFRHYLKIGAVVGIGGAFFGLIVTVRSRAFPPDVMAMPWDCRKC